MNDSTPSGEIEHGLPKPKGNLIHRMLGGDIFFMWKVIYTMSPQNHDKKMVLATLNTFKHVGFGGAMDDIQ